MLRLAEEAERSADTAGAAVHFQVEKRGAIISHQIIDDYWPFII